MDIPFSRYTEKLPEEFSVRHKITETTEKRNFGSILNVGVC